MESTFDSDPQIAGMLLDDATDTRGRWLPAIRDSYDDVERAIETLIELGLRASADDDTALLSLGASLAIVMECLDVHHRAVELDAATGHARPPRSIMAGHLAYCRQVQMRSLESLDEMLRSATSCSGLAQAVVVTGVVMLQDWYAHGRLLSALWAESATPALCC